MLQLGILVDRNESNAWIVEIIRRLRSSTFATVRVVLVQDSKRETDGKVGSLLFRLYEQWDYNRNRSEGDPFGAADLSEALRGIRSISADDPDEVAELTGESLDLLLCFAPTQVSLQGFRYGVLTIRHAGGRAGLPGSFGFWPIYRAEVASETRLVFQKDWQNDGVQYVSFAATDKRSLHGNRAMPLWKAVEMVQRALRELDLDGAKFLASLPSVTTPDPSGMADRYPTNIQMLAFLARSATYWAKVRAGLSQEWPAYKWFIVVRRRLPERRFDDPHGYIPVPCPKDRFYADPFIVEKDGRTYIYFEDFRYSENRACISCCEILPNGSTSQPFEVLRRPYHLSYPFIFEDQGAVYMVPESKSAKKVELLRAVNLPNEWESVGLLMENVYAVDTVIKKIGDKYWMFSSLSDGRFSNSDELSLFCSDSLRGPWQPHPKNPLVSDVRRARSAGTLFEDGGRMIRPSQNCGKAYGYGLVFSEIVTLTEVEYEERVVSSLDPQLVDKCAGNHTYNRTAEFEVTDRMLPEGIIRPTS